MNRFGFLAAAADGEHNVITHKSSVNFDEGKNKDAGDDDNDDDEMSDDQLFGLKRQIAHVLSAKKKRKSASLTPAGLKVKLSGKRGSRTKNQKKRKLKMTEKGVKIADRLVESAKQGRKKEGNRKKLANLY